ncbi:MAG: hypothetical protein BZ138_06295 [Methanosphaera sp. rholeuAM270]|nr:MAG: hypothetical protein BZ138_06295 [Methanosphaera sp. rholeuAM270]
MTRGPVFVDMRKSGEALYDMHPQPIRNIVELADIDVAQLGEVSAEELEQAIDELIVNADIDGAIVRHTVKNVPQSLYKSLTRRSFQSSAPDALFIKTNWEIARESDIGASMPKVTETVIEVDPETGEEREVVVEVESAASAESSFKPLTSELADAIEVLVSENVIQEARKQQVSDIVTGMLQSS